MNTTTSYEDGRLVVTRVYDAPREAVFEAWIETSKVEQWWGCADTTKVKSEIEPMLGGKYNHLMTLHGTDRPSNAIITEWEPPALLAFEDVGASPGETAKVRVEFTEKGTGTEVRLTHVNVPDEYSKYVIDGWTAAFGKLDKLLIEETAAT